MTNFGDTCQPARENRLTKAVQAALYELIQAGSTGTGGRAGALQGPTDVLSTGTCIPSPLDQLGLPVRVGKRRQKHKKDIKKESMKRNSAEEQICK